MLSNVGMNPYGFGGSVVTSQPQVAPGSAGQDGRASGAGETAPAATRPEIFDRVEAVRQSALVGMAGPQNQHAETGLVLAFSKAGSNHPASEEVSHRIPEPEGLSGPSPSFERSPLQAKREEVLQSEPAPPIKTDEAAAPTNEHALSTSEVENLPEPAIATQLTGAEVDQTIDEPAGPEVRESAPIDVPPAREARAEVDFAAIQRMDTPYDSATVDVTR